MHYSFKSILLLSISSNIFAVAIIVFQDDNKNLRQSCDSDKCSTRNRYRFPHYACDCDDECDRFNICCANYSYPSTERPDVKSTCRSVYDGGAFYMIDSCPTSDTVWDDLCRDEWKNEDDIMKMVPVTSLSTGLTYKNYFCFRCHAANDNFLYWKLNLEEKDSNYNISGGNITESEKQELDLKFDGQWIVSLRNNSVQIPVKLLLNIPGEIAGLVKDCDTRIISNCSNSWTDTDISEKCYSYKGVRAVRRGIRTFVYKNVHCALCNFEDLNNIICFRARGSQRPFFPTFLPPVRGSTPFKPPFFPTSRRPAISARPFKPKKLFTFAYLFDVNKSDGDRVGEILKCSDHHIWDPFAKTCRTLSCALPGYKLKDRKCEPE